MFRGSAARSLASAQSRHVVRFSAGKTFFLNDGYCTLVVVDTATDDLVDGMPAPCAAMSHFGFSAELHELCHDVDVRGRMVIPADVPDWMGTRPGAPEPGAAARPAAARQRWEDVVLPE